jgi:hypothetical protein
MLSRPTRAVLDTALQKYRAGRNEPVLVGGISLLKPALRLMIDYRLVIQEVEGPEVLTSYTRWIEIQRITNGLSQARQRTCQRRSSLIASSVSTLPSLCTGLETTAQKASGKVSLRRRARASGSPSSLPVDSRSTSSAKTNRAACEDTPTSELEGSRPEMLYKASCCHCRPPVCARW